MNPSYYGTNDSDRSTNEAIEKEGLSRLFVRLRARTWYVRTSYFRKSSHEYRVETTEAILGILESGIRG